MAAGPHLEVAEVALGLGGNLGDVETALRRALAHLAGSIDGLRIASLYRSRAVSPLPAQPDFLNTAAIGTTRLAADALLALAKALELGAGRRRGPRHGPRPLDIDLLLYGALASDRPELTLPHPRLADRAFVLAPLAEIAPDLRVPPEHRTVAELLGRLTEALARDPSGAALARHPSGAPPTLDPSGASPTLGPSGASPTLGFGGGSAVVERLAWNLDPQPRDA
jgi:2-amino-4-hydroxy-6-hydroxymethyldihydropteridine diphosphokinase